jgi:hypothetical protein
VGDGGRGGRHPHHPDQAAQGDGRGHRGDDDGAGARAGGKAARVRSDRHPVFRRDQRIVPARYRLRPGPDRETPGMGSRIQGSPPHRPRRSPPWPRSAPGRWRWRRPMSTRSTSARSASSRRTATRWSPPTTCGSTPTRPLAEVPLAEVYDLVKSVDRPEATAIFISCTNFWSVGAIEALEKGVEETGHLGRPGLVLALP